MADERDDKVGGAEPQDMFDSLGLKADTPKVPTPPPPPPGAGQHVGGRTRPRQPTLLGLSAPDGKSALGTARPSTRLRAAGEAKPLPPPPPRRGSLPEIEAAAAAAAPPEARAQVSDGAIDDAAKTHIYAKSPVLEADATLEPETRHKPVKLPPISPDESAERLAVPVDTKAEHASIEEILVAKEVPRETPSEAAITKRADEILGAAEPRIPSLPPAPAKIPSLPPHTPSGPPSGSRIPSGPPSGTRIPSAVRSETPKPPPSDPLSVRMAPAASTVPEPPLPPPAAKARSQGRMRAAERIAAAVDAGPPRPQAVTTITKRSANRSSSIAFLVVAIMGGGAAVAFLLMPRSSTLVVNVADTLGTALTRADVFVDGTKRCDDTPCVVRDLALGNHEVRVTASGFEAPPPRTVAIDGRRDLLADFQLAPSKGTGFKVTGAPGIRLAVDGKDVGPLPQDKRDLDPGEHLLHFSGDRYAPLDKKVTIAAGEVTDLGSVPLKVSKGRVLLQLGSPADAKVFLVSPTDRKEVPKLPMAIEFDPSETWSLLATKDGFDDLDEPIRFDDGQADKTIVITLSRKRDGRDAKDPSDASTSPPPATAPPPATPPPPRPQPLAARPQPAPKRTSERSDDDGDGETVLKLNSLPASSIILDGKTIGATPQPHVVVSPGSHTVTFINAELSLKKTVTVDVKAGESKAAFAKLRD